MAISDGSFVKMVSLKFQKEGDIVKSSLSFLGMNSKFTRNKISNKFKLKALMLSSFKLYTGRSNRRSKTFARLKIFEDCAYVQTKEDYLKQIKCKLNVEFIKEVKYFKTISPMRAN